MLKKVFYYTFLGSLFLYGAARFFFPAPTRIETAASYILYPFLLAHQQVMASFAPVPANIVSELERSLHAREALQKELIETKALVQFQQETKEITDFLSRYSTKNSIVAQILLRQFGKTHFYLLDKGSNQGVAQDMIAVYKDCLVGRITQVFPQYSKVQLITDSECKIAAQCVSSKTKGIHEGCKLTDLSTLTFVSDTDPLEQNDLLLSSGQGGFYPAGFGLGRIKSFEKDGYLLRVAVLPLIDVKKLQYCCIIPHNVTLSEAA